MPVPLAATTTESRVAGLLGAGALERLRARVEDGRALPNVAYTSGEWLELEHRHLMWPLWMLAGFGDRIPDAGDALPVQVAGCAIVLVRRRDGTVGAFRNVCPRSGAAIVVAPRRGPAALVCPCHGWSWGPDGRFRTRISVRDGARHGVAGGGHAGADLRAVRCESWRGALFVNLEGAAAALVEHMAPVDACLEGWPGRNLAYGGCLTYDIAANWKHIHENYIDVYHKFAIHPALCQFAPLETSNPMKAIAPCLTMTWHVIARPQAGRARGLPRFADLPGALHREGRMFSVIPTCDINVWPDHVAFLVAEPAGPSRTRETIHVLFAAEAMADRFEAARARVMATWDELNREDIPPLESMQKGRASPAFDGGAFSPFWDPATQHFGRQIAELMIAHERGAR